MNDLISRSALLKKISKIRAEYCHPYITGSILQAPAVDAVPVVRCGDCEWYKKSKRYGYYRCKRPREGMASGVELMPYDYCSYGERRNGDEN